MPCHGEDSAQDRQIADYHELTRIMCDMINQLDRNGQGKLVTKSVRAWFSKHQLLDEKRAEADRLRVRQLEIEKQVNAYRAKLEKA